MLHGCILRLQQFQYDKYDCSAAGYDRPGNTRPHHGPSDDARAYDGPARATGGLSHTFDDIKNVTSHVNCDISITADNTLMINVTKNDPNIIIKLAQPIATSDIELIEINSKSDTDDSPQLFYITDTNTSWSEGQSDKEMYMDAGGTDFENLDFDMTYTDGWDGNLTSIRFDPVAGGVGNIEVNYISFIKLVYDTTAAN